MRKIIASPYRKHGTIKLIATCVLIVMPLGLLVLSVALLDKFIDKLVRKTPVEPAKKMNKLYKNFKSLTGRAT